MNRLMLGLGMLLTSHWVMGNDVLNHQVGVYLEGKGSALEPITATDWWTLRYRIYHQWQAGNHVTDLEISKDLSQYGAVLSPGAMAQHLRVGLDHDAFLAEHESLTVQDYVLTDMDVLSGGDGEPLFVGVWTQGAEASELVTDLSVLELVSLTRRSRSGHVIDVETYLDRFGNRQYAVLLAPGYEPTYVYDGLDWSTFHSLYHDLHYTGLRLVDMEQAEDGTYLGVWQQDCGDDYLWAGQDFLGAGYEPADMMLGAEDLIDYEWIEESEATLSHHPEHSMGHDPCGNPKDLVWAVPADVNARMFNDLPLVNPVDPIHRGTTLHHGGSTGPGN